MKAVLNVQSFLLVVVALALGLVLIYLLKKPGAVSFKELPGLYQCKGFGLPDESFSRLRITPEMILFGVNSDNQEFRAGRLAPRDDGAELENSMELVHHPGFALDPFFAIRITGYVRAISLRAKKVDQELVQVCERVG